MDGTNSGRTYQATHVRTESLAGLRPQAAQGTQRLIRITHQYAGHLKGVNPFRESPQASQSQGHPSEKRA